MACDFRFADRSARFGIPAARLGIVYGVPDSRNLLALVGLSRAKKILFSGRQFGAAEAERIGFIDEVVDASVEAAAKRFAASLTESAPLSIAGAKLILHALASGSAEREHPAIEAAARRSAASRDYEEGVRAFLEKREPIFVGS
jgi:enoyl-CoA hydratase/carnithine racemase